MTELFALGMIVSGFLIIMGARTIGSRLLALTIAAAFAGFAFEPLLMSVSPELPAAIPTWVQIAGGTIFGLWILQALLAFLFGKNVADHAVGNIVSLFVIAVARAGMWPFRWLRRTMGFIDRNGRGD